jgi:allantoin racemase
MARIGFLGTVVSPLRPTAAPELAASLRADTVLCAYPSRVPVFPSTPVERAMQAIGHLEAGLSAQAAGCAAAVIDSVGDYGLPALKSALAIPVVGAGQAGMAEAGRGGRAFSVVTVWPASMNFIVEDLLRDYGFGAQCLGIHNVGVEEDLEMVAGPDGYLERVRSAADAILDRVSVLCNGAAAAGAQAVLLGCTCMSPMASKVAARASVPVINPLLQAAVLADGLARSSAARPLALKPGRDLMVRSMVDAVAGAEAEDCPVCILTAAAR